MREPTKGMNSWEIGKVVHARRAALGLSQARLTLLSGLTRATISRLERGALKELEIGLDDAKLMALLDLVGKTAECWSKQGATSRAADTLSDGQCELQDRDRCRHLGQSPG